MPLTVITGHFNFRSLIAQGRVGEVTNFMSTNSIEFFFLTERWPKPKHSNSMLSIPRFQPPFRSDRIFRRGSGVTIYVPNGFASFHLPLENAVVECLDVKPTLPRRKKFLLFCAYRPSNPDFDKFLNIKLFRNSSEPSSTITNV